MTTSIDVLAYLRSNYDTFGRMQRQKILYYSQAWHLAWFGVPLFNDQVTAWEKGPVVEAAWRVDCVWDDNIVGQFQLTDDERATIDAVFAYYGKFNGTQLSELTHSESPWVDNYVDVGLFLKGHKEINRAEMRTFYSMASIAGVDGPRKPIVQGQFADDAALGSVIDAELTRWAGTLRILADR